MLDKRANVKIKNKPHLPSPCTVRTFNSRLSQGAGVQLDKGVSSPDPTARRGSSSTRLKWIQMLCLSSILFLELLETFRSSNREKRLPH